MAHTLTLIYTAPFFIAALSRTILRERLPRRALLDEVPGWNAVAGAGILPVGVALVLL